MFLYISKRTSRGWRCLDFASSNLFSRALSESFGFPDKSLLMGMLSTAFETSFCNSFIDSSVFLYTNTVIFFRDIFILSLIGEIW